MLRRTIAVLTAGLIVGSLAGPALAQGPSTKGGKKPVGTVAGFDGTTLTVTMNDASTSTFTVAEDLQVKVDHRGRPAVKGNPTRGSLDDLVAGHLVLRMKSADGVLEKIRLRRVAAPVTESVGTETDGTDGTDTTDGTDGTDTTDGTDGTTDGTDGTDGATP